MEANQYSHLLTGIIVALVLACLIPATALAQTGTIEGVVMEDATGEPLPGVNVIVPELAAEGVGAATAGDGSFVIESVPVGTYQVEARSIGYQTQRRRVTVEAGQTSTVQFPCGRATSSLTRSSSRWMRARRSAGRSGPTSPDEPQQLEDAV